MLLVFHDGEIWTWQDGKWIAHEINVDRYEMA